MNSNQKKFLNLSEIWEVYQLIGDSVSNPIHEKLIDEMINILKNSSRQNILKTIRIFFRDFHIESSIFDIAVKMTQTIKSSKFIDFVIFIRTL